VVLAGIPKRAGRIADAATDGEASFEAQRIRGKMASDQDAVAMSDESGVFIAVW
jgi:hypothetical protein